MAKTLTMKRKNTAKHSPYNRERLRAYLTVAAAELRNGGDAELARRMVEGALRRLS